ncbi:MAG: hypothetical protein NWS66_16225 [Saprospiraceae bacterium]|nr:hypothetical protein [Saprospiraceae bacterium]MDP4701489.1 hypothetical protein [Saprospiraceae bacterium]MDP4811387.1 hypothetical protein [Saprospiraceae bacterium]MDP4813785.1 hypothetical protein [Saprospiraceae bacterium]MDP4852959.1 hypothetical protein [Saprospiraceae bacterium]
MNQEKQNTLKFVLVLILFAAFSRIIPHPHNFTPVGGIAVFGSYFLGRKIWAFLVPLFSLWLSDLFINNIIYPIQYPQYYEGFTLFGSFWVYGSFLLMIPIAWGLLSTFTLPRLALTGFSTASLFFLVTNFGSWLNNPIYPQNYSGLLTSYIAGLPFFQNTLLGDICYLVILFGATKVFGFSLKPLYEKQAKI